MSDAYKVVEMFEKRVAKYTNAPYAIAVDNCTNAIFLCLKYMREIHQAQITEDSWVEIPSHTYKSVADSIIHADFKVKFCNDKWLGLYQLKPFPVYDSAKRFTANMYIPVSYMCLSFHGRKILPLGEGGMILTDNIDAVNWFKLARFSGRHEVNYYDDTFAMVGWKMNMAPETAARGLTLMDFVKDVNPDQIEEYTDLSKYGFYK